MAINHFTSLKGNDSAYYSYIYEKNLDRRNEIKNKYGDKGVEVVDDLNQIEDKIDLAFVTTRSSDRYEAVDALLKNNLPSKVLLEKNLSNNSKDLDKINYQVISNQNVIFFVNLWLREFEELTNSIKKNEISEIERIEIECKDQSLLTNLIHFIDYINYLFGIEVSEIVPIGKHEWVSGKRDGTLEFTGRVNLGNSKAVNYQAFSPFGERNVSGETKINIYYRSNKFTIELGQDVCRLFMNEIQYDEFPIYLQSKDGGRAVKKILSDSKEILLPKFSQVYLQQKTIVRDFEKMFNQTDYSVNQSFNIA